MMNYSPIPAMILAGVFFLTACVSNKKFMAETTHLKHEQDSLSAVFANQLELADYQLNDLKLQLAEKKGENNTLEAMRQKLEQRVVNLEDEIESLNNQILSLQQSSDKALQQKAVEVAAKEKILKDLKGQIEERERAMEKIHMKLEAVLQSFDSTSTFWSAGMKERKVHITLYESLLFRTGSTRVRTKGIEVSRKLAEVLSRHPEVLIRVEGHTDNKPPKRGRGIQDNWDLSVLRAASVVRLLTKEFELSPNQVLAAGKGEFAPKTSNETEEGKAQNRRIELVILPRVEDILTKVKASVE